MNCNGKGCNLKDQCWEHLQPGDAWKNQQPRTPKYVGLKCIYFDPVTEAVWKAAKESKK